MVVIHGGVLLMICSGFVEASRVGVGRGVGVAGVAAHLFLRRRKLWDVIFRLVLHVGSVTAVDTDGMVIFQCAIMVGLMPGFIHDSGVRLVVVGRRGRLVVRSAVSAAPSSASA